MKRDFALPEAGDEPPPVLRAVPRALWGLTLVEGTIPFVVVGFCWLGGMIPDWDPNQTMFKHGPLRGNPVAPLIGVPFVALSFLLPTTVLFGLLFCAARLGRASAKTMFWLVLLQLAFWNAQGRWLIWLVD